MKVRDIMTKDVGTATLDSTIEDVAAIMKEEDAGSIPVVEDGELAGIVTDRDIVIRCIAEGKDPSDTTVEEILTEELHTIEPEADVEEAARLMAERQIRRLPVVDGGELIGVISLGDIAVKNQDTEIAGESLEDISQGVRQQRGRTSSQQKGRAEGRAATVSGKKTDTGKRAKITPIRAEKEPRTRRRKTG
jgi:CBS domain-containing protein